jgi:hypothetical protein
MGIVKWCHPGNLVSMPLFGRYYRKKLVTLDCVLLVLFPLHHLVLVANGVSSSASHPHLLGWFVLVPVMGKISFVLSNIKQSWNFCTFCTQNIAARNIQPIRRHLFQILLSWFVGRRRTLRQESGLKTWSQLQAIFGFLSDPKGCKLASQILWYSFFHPWGQYKAIKFSIY